MKHIKICPVCNKEFEIKDRTLEYVSKAKFCSQDCYHKSQDSQKGKYKKGHTLSILTNNPNWIDGTYIRKDGYKTIRASSNVQLLEHRIVAEKFLNRKLTSREHVHHIDGNKLNNNPLNLIVFSSPAAHKIFESLISKAQFSLDNFSRQ